MKHAKKLIVIIGSAVLIGGLAGCASNPKVPTAYITTTKTTVKVANMTGNDPFFAGAPAHCNRATGSSPDCCADSGWSGLWSDPDLKACSPAERTLAQEKAEGVAYHVGDTCIKGADGSCLQPISVYCVFSDKTSYAFQVNGRLNQLGISFGTPDVPDCSGLTRDQINKIDLNKISFINTSVDTQSNEPSQGVAAYMRSIL